MKLAITVLETYIVDQQAHVERLRRNSMSAQLDRALNSREAVDAVLKANSDKVEAASQHIIELKEAIAYLQAKTTEPSPRSKVEIHESNTPESMGIDWADKPDTSGHNLTVDEIMAYHNKSLQQTCKVDHASKQIGDMLVTGRMQDGKPLFTVNYMGDSYGLHFDTIGRFCMADFWGIHKKQTGSNKCGVLMGSGGRPNGAVKGYGPTLDLLSAMIHVATEMGVEMSNKTDNEWEPHLASKAQ